MRRGGHLGRLAKKGPSRPPLPVGRDCAGARLPYRYEKSGDPFPDRRSLVGIDTVGDYPGVWMSSSGRCCSSKRSAIMTLFHTLAKSRTNCSLVSLLA